jgi:hypothetical protein
MQRKLFVGVAVLVLGLVVPLSRGQEATQEKEKTAETKPTPEKPAPKEESSATSHSIQIAVRPFPTRPLRAPSC